MFNMAIDHENDSTFNVTQSATLEDQTETENWEIEKFRSRVPTVSPGFHQQDQQG